MNSYRDCRQDSRSMEISLGKPRAKSEKLRTDQKRPVTPDRSTDFIPCLGQPTFQLHDIFLPSHNVHLSAVTCSCRADRYLARISEGPTRGYTSACVGSPISSLIMLYSHLGTLGAPVLLPPGFPASIRGASGSNVMGEFFMARTSSSHRGKLCNEGIVDLEMRREG